MDNLRNNILTVFEENGVILLEDEFDTKIELDSLTYVTIIVDLEKKFNIELSDDILDSGISFLDIEKSISKSLAQPVVN